MTREHVELTQGLTAGQVPEPDLIRFVVLGGNNEELFLSLIHSAPIRLSKGHLERIEKQVIAKTVDAGIQVVFEFRFIPS